MIDLLFSTVSSKALYKHL